MTVRSKAWTGGDSANAMGIDFIELWDDTFAFNAMKPIVHLHGSAGDFWTFVAQDASRYAYALAQRGFYIIAPLVGTDTWASNVGQGLITATADYAKNKRTGLNKCGVFGRSMGGANGARWIHNNLARVAAFATDSGALDLARERGTDAANGIFYASINAALDPDLAGSGVNDATFNAALATYDATHLAPGITVPQLHGGWVTDTFVGNFDSTVANYVAALSPGTQVTTVRNATGSGSGHTDTLSIAQVVNFFSGITGWT